MLLRRITKHVKDQNWFAVALDFVIVVVGILIAFQITNWSEARRDVRAERALLERLHDELSEAQALDRAASKYFFDQRLKNLVSARLVIFGLGERAELTDAECQSIGFSHYPQASVTSIPLLDELRSTGEVKLIRNKTILREISKLTDLYETGHLLEASNRPKITLLSREFPELLPMSLKKDAVTAPRFDVDPYGPVYTCDTAAMRESTAFRTAFGENVTLQFVLLEAAILPARQSQTDLHDALDKALGEPHDHK